MRWMDKPSRTNALQQRGKHPFDFKEFGFRLAVLDRVKHAQVSREQQEIFELTGRTRGDVKKLPEFGTPAAATTLCDICGNRAGSAPNLTPDPEPFFGRELTRDAINAENKFVAAAPNFEFTEILQGVCDKLSGAMVNLELNTYNLLLRTGDANAD